MKKLKIILQSNLFYVFFFCFLFVFVFVKTKIWTYSSQIPHDTKKIVATITSFKIDGDKISFYFKERETFVGSYYLKSEKEKKYFEKNLQIGKKVELIGENQELQENTIPNTFNYKKYLYHKKIYFSFFIQEIKLLDTKVTWNNKMKAIITKRIEKLGNNPYMKAFILGDKSLMKSEVQEKIQDNGVSHLFALSGMHLSFIYLFLEKVLKRLKFKKVFIYSFFLFYLILTSFPVSFIRAILFTIFIDLNKILKFHLSNIKILFLILFLLLIYNPFYIYDMGFLYTFVVTFSLLFCHDLLQRKHKLSQIVMVSFITFLFSAPITVYNNYEINICSVINNVLLVPFVSAVVFPVALLTFIFSFLMPVFSLLTQILEFLNKIFNSFSYFLIIGKINLWEVLLYYLILVMLLKLRLKMGFMILFFYISFLYHKNIFTPYASVYYLDVGQGDATLLVAPKNKEVILIDTGGKIEYEKENWQLRDKEYHLAETILQFFKSKRIRKLDSLILTHGDLDHVGYADDLIKKVRVDQVLINQGKINEYEKRIIQQVKSVKDYQAKYFKYQNLKTKLYDNENDNSLLSYFQIEKFYFLFMGDASRKVELDVLEKYQLNVQFLKVGHHGSKTSSSYEFINQLKPQYAIISAGRNNRYHHPSKETIDTLNKLNVAILNTQELGTIEIRIKNDTYSIITSLA